MKTIEVVAASSTKTEKSLPPNGGMEIIKDGGSFLVERWSQARRRKRLPVDVEVVKELWNL